MRGEAKGDAENLADTRSHGAFQGAEPGFDATALGGQGSEFSKAARGAAAISTPLRLPRGEQVRGGQGAPCRSQVQVTTTHVHVCVYISTTDSQVTGTHGDR